MRTMCGCVNMVFLCGQRGDSDVLTKCGCVKKKKKKDLTLKQNVEV